MADGVNEQGIQVTGKEDKDFLDFIAGQVKQYVDQQAASGHLFPGQQPAGAPQVTQQPPAQQPWKTTINGQEFTFQSQEELGKFLNDYQQYVQGQLAEAGKPKKPAVEVKPPETVRPNIDKDKFIQSFVDDPIGALADYQQKMEVAQYGGSVKDLLTGIAGTAENQRRALVAYQFRDAHPEFPNDNPQAAQTIAAIVEQNRLPWTSDGLEMAYAFATSKGYIQAAQQEPAELKYDPQKPVGPPAGQRFAPPQPGRGAAPVSDEKTRLVSFANLPLEKMREILAQMPPEAGR